MIEVSLFIADPLMSSALAYRDAVILTIEVPSGYLAGRWAATAFVKWSDDFGRHCAQLGLDSDCETLIEAQGLAQVKAMQHVDDRLALQWWLRLDS